ncbi:putative bifunctional diguanylate cyclase/phosphodiesterase [Oxalobacteraceae bacterium A2-2]
MPRTMLGHNQLTPEILLDSIYNNATEFAVFTMDTEGLVTSWNIGAELIFGCRADDMRGRPTDMLFTPEDIARGEPRREMAQAAATGRAADYRWHLRRDGTRFWADGVLSPVYAGGPQPAGYLKILRDITQRKQDEDEIRRLATSDPLTGLANRAAFDMQSGELAALSQRSGRFLLLLLIDLDQFKAVNDALGHQAGDELLRQAAARIRQVSRGSDFIARLDGDEFALMQLDAPSAMAGGALADKLLAALAQPFLLDGREAGISASIGIAICPLDAAEAGALLRKADLALYQAKDGGRNRFQYYTDELDQAAHRKSADVSELRRLVAQRRCRLAYQPIVDAGGSHTRAVEALLRVAPDSVLAQYPVDYVVSLAQEYGLLWEISHWCLPLAMAQLRRWHDGGRPDLRLCLNVCARELMDSRYLAELDSALQASGLPAAALEIELTERDVIELESHGSQVLYWLRERGCGLVLDDFGTGYSSLSYLRRLPVSGIKLDKSFLMDVPGEADANAVAGSVIALARQLRLQVVAEGVERCEQAAFLAAQGCTLFQGHLYAPALEPVELEAWLRREAATPGPGPCP